jgi:hypothetical protein
MNWFDELFLIFIWFVIIIKVIFVITIVFHIYFSKVDNSESVEKNIIDSHVVYWKGRTEFIFQACMSVLLIILFNPWHNNKKYITREVNLMLYIFGFILLITADWGSFIHQAKWYQTIVNAWQ